MGKEDPGAAMPGGVDDDLAYGQVRSALVALVAGDVETASLVVDVRYKEAFVVGIIFGKAAGEEFPCGREAIEL